MTDDDILREYLPWLRVVAGNLIGFDSPDLQDLVQEGYIVMWRAIRSFKSEAGKLDYWLKFKAHRQMLTVSVRNRAKPVDARLDEPLKTGAVEYEEVTLGDTLTDLAASALLEQIDSAYHHGEIAAAIDRLTPAQRKYVIARFWLGLSGNEMRALGVFGYDPSALWNSRKNGARWKLQAELGHLASR